MLSAVSSLSAAYLGRSALQLLQVSVDRTGTDGSIERISGGLSPLMNGTANAAIDILIRSRWTLRAIATSRSKRRMEP